MGISSTSSKCDEVYVVSYALNSAGVFASKPYPNFYGWLVGLMNFYRGKLTYLPFDICSSSTACDLAT